MILISVALIICLIFCGLTGFAAWVTIKKNFELQDRQKDYNRFHTMMLDMLEEDTQFMKLELIKRLTMDLPETRNINSSIIKFQNTLQSLRTILKEHKMLED